MKYLFMFVLVLGLAGVANAQVCVNCAQQPVPSSTTKHHPAPAPVAAISPRQQVHELESFWPGPDRRGHRGLRRCRIRR